MLKIDNVYISYGEIKAARGISLYVGDSECVAIVGANGASKSTLLKAVMGSKKIDSGSIIFEDRDMLPLPAYKRARLGISLVPEGGRVFSGISVLNNLILGAYSEKDKNIVNQRLDYVFSIFSRLFERKNQSAGTLSGGEKQMLAIARALMGRPKLLMIDEISLGLMPILVDKVFEIIDSLHKGGLTILLAEQNSQKAMEISDRVYLLELGKILQEGKSSEMANDPHIKEAYLGY